MPGPWGDSALNAITGAIVRGLAVHMNRLTVATLAAAPGAVDLPATDLTDVSAFYVAASKVQETGATPTSILVSPATALRLALLTVANGSRQPLLAADATSGAGTVVAGLPLVVSPLVGDDVAFVTASERLRWVVRTDGTMVLDESVFAMTRSTLVLGEACAALGILDEASVVRVAISPAA